MTRSNTYISVDLFRQDGRTKNNPSAGVCVKGMVFLFLGFKPPKQIYCVHLSAEIMSPDRLTGAAAAVNETPDSGHLPISCVAALIPPLSGHRWSLGRSKMALLFSCHSNIGKLTSAILTSASPETQHHLGETSTGGGSAYFFHFWTTTQPKTVKL